MQLHGLPCQLCAIATDCCGRKHPAASQGSCISSRRQPARWLTRPRRRCLPPALWRHRCAWNARAQTWHCSRPYPGNWQSMAAHSCSRPAWPAGKAPQACGPWGNPRLPAGSGSSALCPRAVQGGGLPGRLARQWAAGGCTAGIARHSAGSQLQPPAAACASSASEILRCLHCDFELKAALNSDRTALVPSSAILHR